MIQKQERETMHKKSKRNPRAAGRNPLPADKVLKTREACFFRKHEHSAFVAAAADQRVSRSNLLRRGLRAIGVQLDPEKENDARKE